MVTALSRLLKNIAKGSKTIVTIQDEFSFLDDYFLIQKYRYGGAIRLEYKIDDKELLANKILRFTLQPIVENAIFHGIEPKGCEGIITIHLYSDDKTKIKIDITDNGIGMTPELIQKILSEDEPDKSQFFRDVGISSVHKRLQYTFGSTCGLFIRQYYGKIHYHDRYFKKYTGGRDFRMYKLLIVDDEPLVQVGLKSMLNWNTLHIEICGIAGNGQEALDLIARLKPHIVIADIRMPVMSGLDLVRKCREQTGELPVFIMLTSYEEFEYAREALRYHVAEYLVKLELTRICGIRSKSSSDTCRYCY